MTIPANLALEGAPYGAQPVIPVIGPQGGPYTVRGPQQTTLLPPAARTASLNTSVQANSGFRGLYLNLNVTVNPGGAQTLALQLSGFDSLLGFGPVLMTIGASATPGGVYLLYPGASGAAVEGIAATRNLVLPPVWYAGVVHSGAGAWTYSLTAWLLP